MIKDRDFLLLEKIRTEREDTPSFQLIREESEYTTDFQIPHEKEVACFDADKLSGTITLRRCQTGDTFIPFGRKERKK